MWFKKCRFTFPHAFVFYESDCSSRTFVEVVHVWGFLRLSSFTMHGIAAEQYPFPVSDEHQPSPWSNLCHRWIPRGFLCCGVQLAVWHFLLPMLQFLVLFVCWIIVSKLQIINCLECFFWIFVGLPLKPLVSCRMLCTQDLESCSSSPLLRKIDILRFGPYIIDNMFRDIVETRLSLSHYVDVSQWDLECFIISVIKLQTRFFTMSKNIFSTHGPRISCFASFLSPSSIPTSSCSRFPSAVDDGLGLLGCLRISFTHGNS